MADNYLHMQQMLLRQPHDHVESKPYRVDLDDNGTVTLTISNWAGGSAPAVLTGSTPEGRAQLADLATEVLSACAGPDTELP